MIEHAAEFRRCLIRADVKGIMKVWSHVAPHLMNLSPVEALITLHMARVEAKSIPRNLKEWSSAFLAERGYHKIDGTWIKGPPGPIVAEAVGIASMSRNPILANKVTGAMKDALLNGWAKGVTEAHMLRESMLKARAKVRSKERV